MPMPARNDPNHIDIRDSQASTGSAKPRILWMDLLRGVGILLVIVLHSTTILERFDVFRPEWMSVVNNAVGPFRIPMLMFLSGLLLPASISKPAEAYFVGKIRNIAYPYIVWTLIYAALIGIEHSWYHPKFWAGGTYLWYLLFLLTYYVCAFVLRDIRPIVVFAVALAASMLAPDGSKYGERILYLMAFFFLGYAVSTAPLWKRILEDKRVLILAPLILVFGALSAVYGPFRYGVEYAVPSFVGIIVLCVFARIIMNTKFAAPFVYIGQNGIVFYVTHYPVIFLAMTALTSWGMTTAAPISAISLGVALSIGFLLSWLASFLWFVRLFFVGPPVDAWLAPWRAKQSVTR